MGALTNFLCTDISGTFTLNETVTGGTSGATGIYKETDAARNIIKLSNVTGTFVGGDNKSGETITGGRFWQNCYNRFLWVSIFISQSGYCRNYIWKVFE